MTWPMIRSARDHLLKMILSVTIIAGNENGKIPSLYDLCIFSSFTLLVFPTDFFKNCSPLPNFWIFHFSFQRKKVGLGGGRELYLFI